MPTSSVRLAQEFRLYAINASGDFADDSFDFHPNGTMQKTFEGWIRLTEVQAPEDRQILDFHAPAVLVDWQLEVERGGMVKQLGADAVYAWGPQRLQMTFLSLYLYLCGQLTTLAEDQSIWEWT